jgi:hypothetical protein
MKKPIAAAASPKAKNRANVPDYRCLRRARALREPTCVARLEDGLRLLMTGATPARSRSVSALKKTLNSTALAFSNSLAVLGARDSNELSSPSNRS